MIVHDPFITPIEGKGNLGEGKVKTLITPTQPKIYILYQKQPLNPVVLKLQ